MHVLSYWWRWVHCSATWVLGMVKPGLTHHERVRSSPPHDCNHPIQDAPLVPTNDFKSWDASCVRKQTRNFVPIFQVEKKVPLLCGHLRFFVCWSTLTQEMALGSWFFWEQRAERLSESERRCEELTPTPNQNSWTRDWS